MKKHLKNEQRSRDAAAKKGTNTSGIGVSNNYYKETYIIIILLYLLATTL